FERFAANDNPTYIVDGLARLCNEFNVCAIAADHGGGSVFNGLLVERLRSRVPFFAIRYSEETHPSRNAGFLHHWPVARTTSIGILVARVKARRTRFPSVRSCTSFLDEFACELAVHDDRNRGWRYTHPESQQDDALHAANYGLLLAMRRLNAEIALD